MSDPPSWLEVGSRPDPPAFDDLAPGEDRQWLTTVRNTADRPVPLTLQVRGDGDLLAVSGGLAVEVRACSEPWQPSGGAADAAAWTCPGTSRVVAAAAPPDGTVDVVQPRLGAGESRDYLATATLPATSGNATQDLDGTVTLRFTSTQPGPGPDEDDDLAGTGASVTLMVVLAAVLLALAWWTMRRARRT